MSVHIGVFVNYDLCTNERQENGNNQPTYSNPSALWGQYKEVMAREDELTCEHCKMLLNVMRANGFTPLFNSDQWVLARELKAILK